LRREVGGCEGGFGRKQLNPGTSNSHCVSEQQSVTDQKLVEAVQLVVLQVFMPSPLVCLLFKR
jgi:hypothetical protein